MVDDTLVFIPYQDTDNFFEDGILTREFAILYMLYNSGYKNVVNIKKPRTLLDKRRYIIHNEYYPSGTIEHKVKNICNESTTIQYLPLLSIMQIIKRRAWWIAGYKKTIDMLPVIESDCKRLVFSDNPYALEVLKHLKDHGYVIYFDVMDNFAIHPSLNESEQLNALNSYREILQFADIVSANSVQTCEFMNNHTGRTPILVKNGVFEDNPFEQIKDNAYISMIREAKRGYKRTIGYIGKLGLRLDADLIDKVTSECKDCLFVFVGGYLKGQVNNKLIELFDNRANVLHVDAVPSAYVYSILDEFDILSIPHAVGKAENGGDPLKLYQYLTRNKPIITTPILGVEEFKDVICIAKNADQWINYINSEHHKINTFTRKIIWEERFKPILELIK